MANRRMIDGSFWDDKAIHKRMSERARYLFLALISHADDEGRVDADPAFLKSRVWLYDETVTVGVIQAALEEIANVCQSVCLYESDGEQFVAFLKWEQYQSIKNSRGSRCPAPPVETIPPVSKPGPKRKLHAPADNDPIGSNSQVILSDGIGDELQSNSNRTGPNARAEMNSNEIEVKRREESAATPPLPQADWREAYRQAVNLNLSKPVEAAHGEEFAAEYARLGEGEFKRRLVWWLSVGGGPKNAEKQLEVLRVGVEAMKRNGRGSPPTPADGPRLKSGEVIR
jgi:hypothetical protein